MQTQQPIQRPSMPCPEMSSGSFCATLSMSRTYFHALSCREPVKQKHSPAPWKAQKALGWIKVGWNAYVSQEIASNRIERHSP